MASKLRGSAKERSVFVGNIPYDVTEEQLHEIFSEVGSVINFRLVTDRETGKPKGYGFCEYADGATALSAMRNLNGYEVSGRNLRVDFADGGEKTGSGNGNNNSSSIFSTSNSASSSSSNISGEALILAIEAAINKFGPLKLYDLLVQLKEHARQRPDYTKQILNANPALTHAVVQCFKRLKIPLNEAQPLLSAPLLPPPGPPMNRSSGGMPPPQRSPLHAAPQPMSGGILGMAPPTAPILMAPPATTKYGSVAGPSSDSGRWVAPPSPSRDISQSSAHLPPPISQPPVQPSLMPTPSPVSTTQRGRDPRTRARDPRLANKRGASTDSGPETSKRGRVEDQSSEYAALAELARDMTPEKLNKLPAEERQLLFSYMEQHGIQY